MQQRAETIRDLINEIESIKETKTKGILEMKNLGKQTGATDASITNRLQDMEVRISGTEDIIEKA